MSHRLSVKPTLSATLLLLLMLGQGDFSPAQAQTTGTSPATQAKAKAKEKSAEPAQKSDATKKLIDINKATAEEMVDVLPGVGAVTAKKIVEGRPYAKIDDLAKAGIPARTVEGIRTLVTVGATTEPATKGEATKKMAPPAKEAVAKTKTAAPAPAAPTGKVNLNTATTEELETLPGIGPAYAKKIIELRPIKKLTDLEKIKGLSSEKIEELDEHVIILAAAPPKAETPATTSPATPAPEAKAKTAAATKGTGASSTKSETTHLSPGQKINLNKASQDDLQLLPGIGPVKSQAIIDGRPFKTIEDVMKVKGIKEGSFAKIKDHIVVD